MFKINVKYTISVLKKKKNWVEKSAQSSYVLKIIIYMLVYTILIYNSIGNYWNRRTKQN